MNWKSLSWKIVVLMSVAFIIFIWLIKAPIMSWYLTDMIKVPVSMKSISMWPSQTIIRQFRVSNPRGFKNKSALEAKNTTIDYRFKQLMSNPTEIDLIKIDGIFLSIDCTNPLCSSNNWTAIGDRMAMKEKKAEKKKGRKVVLHKLILSDLTVEIRGLGINQPPQIKKIARLEFNEINSDKGFPTKKLIQAIFQGAGFDQFIKDTFNPENIIKPLLPNLFGTTKLVPVESRPNVTQNRLIGED